MNPMQTMASLRKATLAARERTGSESISTRADKGRIDVCSVSYAKGGKSTVASLSGYVAPEDAVKFLDQMGA